MMPVRVGCVRGVGARAGLGRDQDRIAIGVGVSAPDPGPGPECAWSRRVYPACVDRVRLGLGVQYWSRLARSLRAVNRLVVHVLLLLRASLSLSPSRTIGE